MSSQDDDLSTNQKMRSTKMEPEKAVFAVRYLSHWDGEPQALMILCHQDEVDNFTDFTNDESILKYPRDAVLEAWPLIAGEGPIQYVSPPSPDNSAQPGM